MKNIKTTYDKCSGNKRIILDLSSRKPRLTKKLLSNFGVTEKILETYGTTIDTLIQNVEKFKKNQKKDFIRRKKSFKNNFGKYKKETGNTLDDYIDEHLGMPPDGYSYYGTEIILNSKSKILTIITCSAKKSLEYNFYTKKN